jgi:hypothetical protein
MFIIFRNDHKEAIYNLSTNFVGVSTISKLFKVPPTAIDDSFLLSGYGKPHAVLAFHIFRGNKHSIRIEVNNISDTVECTVILFDEKNKMVIPESWDEVMSWGL